MKNNISLTRIIYFVNILFLIVLENFALDSGMGYLGLSVILVSFLFSAFIGDLNSGVEKMVVNRNNRGLNGSNGKVLRIGLLYHTSISVILTLAVLIFSSAVLKRNLGDSYSMPILILTVLAFTINGWINILTGYVKGNGNDSVYRLAEILKMILPVILAFPIVHFAGKHGKLVAGLLKTPVVENAYFAMGIAVTYVVSYFLILLVIFLISLKNHELFRSEKTLRVIDSGRSLFNNFQTITFQHLMSYLFPFLAVGAASLMYFLTSHKNGAATAELYSHTGILFSKIYLPVCLVLTVFSSYVENEQKKMRIDLHNEERKTVVIRCQHLLKNTFFLLLPPALVYTFLGDPFSKVFFTGNYKLSSLLIRKSGMLILMAGLVYVLHNILRCFIKEYLITAVEALSFLIQIISLGILLRKNGGGITAVIISFYINLGIQLIVCALILYRMVRLNLTGLLVSLGKFIAGAAALSLVFIILDRFIMMNVFLLILSIVLGYLVYYLTVIVLKGVTRRDIQSMKRTLNYYPLQFLSSRLNIR